MVRAARPGDVPAIYRLIRELARYEKSLAEVTGTEEDLRRSLFGPGPAVFAHVAEDGDGAVVGFALWFLNYSTWQCQQGIYLEDLYVRPELRGAGYGRQLLTELAALCVERGYGRLDWAVNEWEIYRLSGPALAALGSADETRTRQ